MVFTQPIFFSKILFKKGRYYSTTPFYRGSAINRFLNRNSQPEGAPTQPCRTSLLRCRDPFDNRHDIFRLRDKRTMSDMTGPIKGGKMIQLTTDRVREEPHGGRRTCFDESPITNLGLNLFEMERKESNEYSDDICPGMSKCHYLDLDRLA